MYLVWLVPRFFTGSRVSAHQVINHGGLLAFELLVYHAIPLGKLLTSGFGRVLEDHHWLGLNCLASLRALLDA
jgi:hypothetical protein